MSLISSPKIIETKILENFIEYQELFIGFQSSFLSGLYNRYQGLENGNLVLYFAKLLHQDILRHKDYDLNFDLSFNKFWENHHSIIPKKKSIIQIANDTYIPKETARRKIAQLTKKKILSRQNKNLGWLPNEQYKKSYNLFIQKEIENVSSLVAFVCKKIDLPFSREKISEEYKQKFSFYWFHYLNAQIEYLKSWRLQIKDLDLLLISLQVASMFASQNRKNNISHETLYRNPSVIKNSKDSSINATSISEVTGIPRGTCIRKLETLVKLKMISQDKISKRYYLSPQSLSNNLISKQLTEKVIKIFSKFYFICLRALTTKP
jgi:response regulator of citrate/malate metabolism